MIKLAKPTKSQLQKINALTGKELEADQVYVFTSLSADTLPVKRNGFFGSFELKMSKKFLSKLKNDYRKGAALLAGHNSERLPFGRTFDAKIMQDEVNGSLVDTLYIDQYITKYVVVDGEKKQLNTELGLTTEDIVNHIEAGHTFDTSIGFQIDTPVCSICNHDIRSSQCSHMLGQEYVVENELMKCGILVEGGEGIENSLVYAGAVNRAIITKTHTEEEENLEVDSKLQLSVKDNTNSLYNVKELKNIPIESSLFCYLSKGEIHFVSNMPEKSHVERENLKMEQTENHVETPVTEELEVVSADVEFEPEIEVQEVELEVEAEVELTIFNEEVTEEKQEFSLQQNQEFIELQHKFSELKEQNDKSEMLIEELNKEIVALKEKASFADQFAEEIKKDVIKYAIRSRGNQFNVERYGKYLSTLSFSDMKEELNMFKEEFSSILDEARITAKENFEQENVLFGSDEEIRQEAARQAMVEFSQNKKGNLAELTKIKFNQLKSKTK